MATLKEKSTATRDVISEYRDKTLVVLEGETDVNLFRNYWFQNRLDRIDFVEPESVSECGGGGGGCNAVIRDVAFYRQKGTNAFGLVDRDKLQADKMWDLVWQTDDAIFDQAFPYGPHVKITRYWEIESYLIDPSSIEKHLCNKDGGRQPRSDDTVEQECLVHAEALIPHAAMNYAKRKIGEKEFPDTQTSRFSNKSGVEKEYQCLKEKGEICDSVWCEYQKAVPKVEAFAYGKTSRQRLFGLLRRVNGKAMLERIIKKDKLLDKPNFFLAAAIRDRKAIPQELIDFIDIFCGANGTRDSVES
jgi:hypothetical protein